MNNIDIFVIAVLAIFMLVGIYRGFMLAVIRMATVLISAVVSLVGYPVICSFARKTFVYSGIKKAIITHLDIENMVIDSTKQGQSILIDSLPLPPSFKESLLVNNNSVVYDLLDVNNIVDYIGGFLANIALNVLMSVLIFISCFVIIRVLLKTFSLLRKAPVIRTIGRVGGGISGLVIGTVFIWSLFAIMDAFVTQPFFATIYEDIQLSQLAKLFYDTNPIREFMLTRMF